MSFFAWDWKVLSPPPPSPPWWRQVNSSSPAWRMPESFLMAVEGMPNYPASFLLALPLCIWIMMEKGHRSGAQSCCLEESYLCQLRRVSSLQGTSHSSLPGPRDPWSHGAAAGKNLNPCTRVTCHRLSALCGIELRPDSVGTGRAELPAEIYTAAHQEMGSHLWFCCVALGMLLIACIQIDARPKSGEALQTTASSRNTNTTLRESLQEQRYFKLKTELHYFVLLLLLSNHKTNQMQASHCVNKAFCSVLLGETDSVCKLYQGTLRVWFLPLPFLNYYHQNRALQRVGWGEKHKAHPGCSLHQRST